MERKQGTAIIVGAGPAGLTAALELCRHSSIRPIVLEASPRVGGLSCTVVHHGNRIDLGGHRFFSKSDRVMEWWTDILPLADASSPGAGIRYRNQSRAIPLTSTAQSQDTSAGPDGVMLLRPRKSRIYFMRSLFDYPLSFSARTLRRLGLLRTLRVLTSYIGARAFPRRPEASLEDFLINRFGNELYLTFFKSYTEKVWGVPCNRLPAAWGAQRIKSLSLGKAASHFFGKLCRGALPRFSNLRHGNIETSLIEQFLYPQYGPGQLWERVAALVIEGGGEIRLGWRVTRLHVEAGSDGMERIASVQARTPEGALVSIPGRYFFSTMPVRELARALDAPVPAQILAVSDGLLYRDFITVGLLVDRLLITEPDGSSIDDTWIYIHEPDVRAGRLQIFNNWSPYLVADPAKVWIGLEYFLSDTDALWNKSDSEIAQFAIREAASLGILNSSQVRDSCVLRAPKAYPSYAGTYHRFGEIIRYMDRFENLFLVGRNGMHRYNNQDHSMLTAMMAVENILSGVTGKANLWAVNTEMDYHEHQPAVCRKPAVEEAATPA